MNNMEVRSVACGASFYLYSLCAYILGEPPVLIRVVQDFVLLPLKQYCTHSCGACGCGTFGCGTCGCGDGIGVVVAVLFVVINWVCDGIFGCGTYGCDDKLGFLWQFWLWYDELVLWWQFWLW